MSLFSGPEEHAANPPDTWQVAKRAERLWTLTTSAGDILATYGTKREAENALTQGFYASQYEKERRWYAGEKISGWRPWVDVRLDQLRQAIRSESISYGELVELQSLTFAISADDVELLQWAGVEEF